MDRYEFSPGAIERGLREFNLPWSRPEVQDITHRQADREEGMTMTDQAAGMTPSQIVDALVPVIERAIARRMEEVYGSIEQLREEFQQTINVMDGNDQAIVAALQEIRGKISGEGYQVAEVLAKAGESWERFVRAEAEKLGLKVITPKTISVKPSNTLVTDRIEVRELTDDEAAAEERTWD